VTDVLAVVPVKAHARQLKVESEDLGELKRTGSRKSPFVKGDLGGFSTIESKSPWPPLETRGMPNKLTPTGETGIQSDNGYCCSPA
jgi:hypothetical protein